MSLDQLRTLRRGGSRPASVSVIVGKPRPFDDGPGVVVIHRDPREVDLSPLVAMPVHVLDLYGADALTLRVLSALDALKVVPLGVCGPAGACGVSAEHEQAMDRYRRSLCTS